jgi:programmed cell death 6-interacting protein
MYSQLNSMGLPGSIEALDQPQGLPKSVMEKSAKVISLGGASLMREQLHVLEQLKSVGASLLKEISSILSKERKDDEEARGQFPQKFTRVSSLELQKNMLVNVERYSKTMVEAEKADKIVREKFDKCIPFIEILSSEESLKRAIPNGSTANRLPQAALDVINAIKAILKDLGTSRQGLDKIGKDIKALGKSDDVSTCWIVVMRIYC